MEPGNIAIIGGTGFERLPPEIFAEPLRVATEFGTVPVLSVSNNYTEPYKLYFISRHGDTHRLAPHQIDYRANVAAMCELGVRFVLASNTVGSLRKDLPPGSLVLLSDFLDFTRGRVLSYFGDAGSWSHTDFTTPYSTFLRDALVQAASIADASLVEHGTYVCCDGPRFETPAEIRMFAALGGDVVGMTGLPEAIFAREAGLEYAALCVVTNYGAGLTSSPVSHADVVAEMEQYTAGIRELFLIAGGLIANEMHPQ